MLLFLVVAVLVHAISLTSSQEFEDKVTESEEECLLQAI